MSPLTTLDKAQANTDDIFIAMRAAENLPQLPRYVEYDHGDTTSGT